MLQRICQIDLKLRKGRLQCIDDLIFLSTLSRFCLKKKIKKNSPFLIPASSPPKIEPLDSNTLSPFGHQDPRPTVHHPRSAETSGPRARSSLFAVQSASGLEKPEDGPAGLGSASSSAKLVVRNRDTDWLRRAEPEGCSTAPQSPLAVGPPPTPDDRDPAADEAASPPPPAGLGPLPEDPEDQASMSDASGQSSLTVRVAKLLRDGLPAASVSDREDPKHKSETGASSAIAT